MAFESAFLSLMPDTITRNAFVRRSTAGTGEPAYSATATTIQARVVAGPMKVRTVQGLDVVATHTMWCASTMDISAQDKITFGGSTFQIVEVLRYPDDEGRHHTRLRCRGG